MFYKHTHSVPPTHANDYNVWGVSVAEAELDILTGQHKIRRVDILQDTGVRFVCDVINS